MKKIFSVLFILIVSCSISFSAEKMPADIKSVTDKITKLTTDYFKAINKVKSANDLASVINRYADGMEKLGPSIKALEAKYGNAGDEEDEETANDDTDYPEFQGEWAEIMSGSDMNVNFQNLAKYSSDPAVQKAMERLSSVMEKIGIPDDEGSYEEDEGDTGDENEEEYGE